MPDFTVTLTQVQADAIAYSMSGSVQNHVQSVISRSADQVLDVLRARRRDELSTEALTNNPKLQDIAIVAHFLALPK